MKDVEGTKEKSRVLGREIVSTRHNREGKRGYQIRGRRIRDEEMRKKDESGRERKN